MPPHHTPETNSGDDRSTKRELLQLVKDLNMKIADLESSVERLIAAAQNIKNQPVPTPTPQEDDPAVERLYNRIESAIAILEGREPVPQPAPIDPNAPAQPVV